MKKISWITSLLIGSLVMFVFFNASLSHPAHAHEKLEYVQVQEDTTLYSEGEQPLGELKAGAVFIKASQKDDRVFIQWGEDKAYVKRQDTKTVKELASDEAWSIIPTTDIEAEGKLELREDSEVYIAEDETVATLHQGVEYEYSGFQDGTYQLVIGNRLLLLAEDAVAKKDETLSEEAEEALSEQEKADSNRDDEVDKRTEKKQLDQQLQTQKKKADFSSGYFEVADANLTVYDNSTGSLVPVGHLEKGEVYPIESDYGNWHRIQFHDEYGYVRKDSTRPASGKAIQNENKGEFTETGRKVIASQAVTVYDNSSGRLVPFATLHEGSKAPILSDYGSWWRVEVANRIGYVHKSAVHATFLPSDQYFQVTEDHVTVYDNSTGSLVPVGHLEKGEVYPIESNYGNWHRIQFHDEYGYVRKDSTRPASGKAIQNENKGEFTDTGRKVIASQAVTVYDNSSGRLVPFATLHEGSKAPILSDYGSWWRVEVANRVGYVLKHAVQVPFRSSDRYFKVFHDNIPIYSKGKEKKLGELQKGEVYPRIRDYGTNWHEIQFGNGYAYVEKSLTHPDDGNGIRNESNGDLQTIGKTFRAPSAIPVKDNSGGQLVTFAVIEEGTTYPIVNDYGNWWQVEIADRIGYVYKASVAAKRYKTTQYDISFQAALDKQMSVNPQTDLYTGYWKPAKKEDVARYLNPDRFKRGTDEYYQFLVLSGSAGVPKSELARILRGKGVLAGKAGSFIKASQTHDINEVYLIAHALLETGNGTSSLAKGIMVDEVDGKSVEPKRVYNFYGIGAYDNCVVSCGAERAYEEGWFTPEKAIIGGAEYIAKDYIAKGQDTLYKMRWNPANPATHQYATDIGWAVKQVDNIANIYNDLISYDAEFDVPKYK